MPNYLYNGVELPELPEWDKEKYPYAYIGRGQNMFFEYQYTLYLTEKPLLFAFGILCNSDMYYTTYKCKEEQISNGVWSIVTEDEHGAIRGAAASPSVWSNYDIYEEDSTTVIYLAASAPVPKKYLYNGNKLSALPEWDKTLYPYAAIINEGGSKYPTYDTRLIVSDKPIFVGTKIWDDSLYWCSKTPIKWAQFSHWMVDDWEFEHERENAEKSTIEEIKEYYFVVASDYVLWSNYEMLNADGTLLLSASYPIDAETGEEIHDYEIAVPIPDPLPVSPYLPINGAWVKHDIYKQVGNSWVKQPQGAVEVEGGAWQGLS